MGKKTVYLKLKHNIVLPSTRNKLIEKEDGTVTTYIVQAEEGLLVELKIEGSKISKISERTITPTTTETTINRSIGICSKSFKSQIG